MEGSKLNLSKIGIHLFEEMADGFDDANLFLGNGFSINLCSRLMYNSLFNFFIEKQPNNVQQIFKAFGTTNFEEIIQRLNDAEVINKLLDLPYENFYPIAESLKKGLIDSIQANHPAHREIEYRQLRSLSDEILYFQDVFTTNYDVFLYKIIIEKISEYKERGEKFPPYQDYFYEEIYRDGLGFNPEKMYEHSRSIYYLHGSLFIYEKSSTYKLRKIEDVLVEYLLLIRREIEFSNFPVFVAEGNDKDKIRTINNNRYLRFCASKLQDSVRNLVVYGFSFGSSDFHIVDFINKSKIKDIAVSVYVGSKTIPELESEVSYFNNLFPNKRVVLYNSSSLFNFSIF